jgi:FKBP-type peptidyl-prolyl cis-trans isomerase FkpA
MRGKIFRFIVICFVAYAFLTQPGTKPSIEKIKQVDNESVIDFSKKDELLTKIKSYIALLSSDSRDSSLLSKESPIINEKNNYVQTSADNKKTTIEDKVANIIYNVLHTSQGKEILENILLMPLVQQSEKKDALNENPYNNNSIIDVIQGEGERINCGNIVTTHYITRLVNGQEVENTYKNEQPAIFQVGDGSVIKGLEYAIIGMQKGGVRRLVTVPRFSYNRDKFSQGLVSSNEFITIDVEILDLKDEFKTIENKITIFPDIVSSGNTLLCGDEIYFNYKISTTTEKLIYKSDKLAHFILGSSSVPPVINKIFLGLKSNTKRVALLPSGLLYKKNVSFIPNNIYLPEKEMILLEITTYDLIK